MRGSKEPLIIASESGLYCPQGDFYIDPGRSVARALITHAHSDHARPGSKSYLAAAAGAGVLRARLGAKAAIQTLPYGEHITVGGVNVSFHPAGHVLGSAQIRLEYRGRVWVVSGDYKTRTDPTCTDFELVKCHCFITESTFALPVYRWPHPAVVGAEINSWWRELKQEGRAGVIYAYSFGKAQRLLSMLDLSVGPIYVHGAIDKMTREYLSAGVSLPEYRCIDGSWESGYAGALLLTPGTVAENFGKEGSRSFSTASASGWMAVRQNRQRQNVDRGFVLSDHADWDELLDVIYRSEAEEIIVTHGYVAPFVRYLNEQGVKARSFPGHCAGKTLAGRLSAGEASSGGILERPDAPEAGAN